MGESASAVIGTLGADSPASAMRRVHGIRYVALVAILLVATAVSGRAIRASECECCGPSMTALPAPIAPCCVSAVERRVATLQGQPDTAAGPLAAARPCRAEADRVVMRPVTDRRTVGPPLHMLISLFRI